MNDPTKQDDKAALPHALCVKAFQRLAAKCSAQQNAASGTWSVKAVLRLQKEYPTLCNNTEAQRRRQCSGPCSTYPSPAAPSARSPIGSAKTDARGDGVLTALPAIW